jgi:hypothetical protein
MTPETSGAVRHILTAIGVLMVSLGWIEADKVEALVGNVMAIVLPFAGVVVTAVPIWLSIRAKQAASKEAKLIAAKVAVAGVPIAPEIAAEKAKAVQP